MSLWPATDSGQRAYKVDGKAFRMRKTFVLEDASGQEVAKIQERFRVRETYGVEIAADQPDELMLAITVCIDAMARG